MKHVISTLLCVTLFAACLAGIDHLFVNVSADIPGYRQARVFYLDFRSRLLAAKGGERKASIEKVVAAEEEVPSKGELPKRVDMKEKPYSPGYVYADGDGNLQFADTLEEVPRKYRKVAQALAK